MWTDWLYLRRFYVNPAAQVFYAIRIKKVNRIGEYRRIFKKKRYVRFLLFNISKQGMYPKDCCKIQPSNANHISTHYIHIMQSCHHIMPSRFARDHEFDKIAYNIIPFVSKCGLHRLLFFYNFLPLPQSGII